MEILENVFTAWTTYLSMAVAVGGIGLAYLAFYKKSIDVDAFVRRPAVKPLYNMLLARYGFTKGYDWVGRRQCTASPWSWTGSTSMSSMA